MSSAPIGLPAIGTLLQYGNGTSPESFTTIANVTSITGPSLAATVVDVTTMSTLDAWRQKLVTLKDGGDVSFDLIWIPSSAALKAILQLFNTRGQGSAGIPIDFRLVFPDVGGTTYSFSGFFSKFGFTEAVADVVRAKVDITITGAVTTPA